MMLILEKILLGMDYNPAMADVEPSLYEMLGGEAGIRALVNRFYDLVDSAPQAQNIRRLHAKSLNQSREKLFMFLRGWSGGPQLYIQRFGHPRLRMRHMPFPIGTVERDEWLWCMNKVLDESQLDPGVVEYLKNHFKEAANFLRNQAEG